MNWDILRRINPYRELAISRGKIAALEKELRATNKKLEKIARAHFRTSQTASKAEEPQNLPPGHFSLSDVEIKSLGNRDGSPDKDFDVFFFCYPKSGKSWISFMYHMYCLHFYGVAEHEDLVTFKQSGLPPRDTDLREFIRTSRTKDAYCPLIVLGHGGVRGFSYPLVGERIASLVAKCKAKHIAVLCRDPRDVLVSHYHHVLSKDRGFGRFGDRKALLPTDLTLSEFLRSDHYGIRHVVAFMNAWDACRADDNRISFVYYEEVRHNPEASLRALLDRFSACPIKDESVTYAVANSSFSRMREVEIAARERAGSPVEDSQLRLRRGVVGSHVEELSEEDIAFLDRIINDNLSPTFSRYYRQ